MTWGSALFGGDSTDVQDQLRSVQQIHATGAAFAAILADGSVVTWGDREFGGDSSGVRDQLRRVQQIKAYQGYRYSICCYPVRWIDRCVGQSGTW